jgi:hypothetical protein
MCSKSLRKRPLSFSKDAALVEVAQQFGASAFSGRSSVRRSVGALLLGDRLGETRKSDGFRRLDHLARAIEEDRDPFADSSAAVPRFSHERKGPGFKCR